MHFDLTDEQTMLRDSLRRLLSDRYSFEDRKKYMALSEGYNPELWRTYADLGLLGLPFDEADGGFGGGAAETMLVSEELGRVLALEPYFATVVLAGSALRHAGSDAQKQQHIAAIASGEASYAFASAEPQSGYDLFDVATMASQNGDSWQLSGTKSLVLHGETADWLVVSARSSGQRRDKDGISLFLVDATAPGVQRKGYQTQDGQRAADVILNDVPAELLGDPGKAWPVLERISQEAIAALCAEAVGIMDEAVNVTVDYLKMRKQFGVPLAVFQALQHRAADMLVELEQARGAAFLAAMALDEGNAATRAAQISAAKIKCGKAARFVGQQAVQLHGGIGVTMEYNIGHAFKRLSMIELSFGDVDYHLNALSAHDGLF